MANRLELLLGQLSAILHQNLLNDSATMRSDAFVVRRQSEGQLVELGQAAFYKGECIDTCCEEFVEHGYGYLA